MKQYLELLENIKTNGIYKGPAREGMPGTYEINGQMMKFDLQQGFPLLTTKKMFFKGIAAELCWFLRGETNIVSLWQHNCHIWDQDAFKFYNRLFPQNRKTFEEWKNAVSLQLKLGDYTYGDCGNIYGYQWTNFEGKFNQIKKLLYSLQNTPDSRYHIVSAWNPQDFLNEEHTAALPACHMMFQCFTRGEFLDLLMYQRSCDTVLGVPFNVASYSLLLTILAKATGYKPGVFTWVGGSVHIYENHLDAVNTQLQREPLPLPTIKVKDFTSLDELTPEYFTLENYNSHPAIKAELSVGV